jgi:hypothetical protein
MLAGRLTHATVRILDWIAGKTLPPSDIARHLHTGRRGEEDAYFYLRSHGYIVVARNFRSPNRRGEIDLIAWTKRFYVLSRLRPAPATPSNLPKPP